MCKSSRVNGKNRGFRDSPSDTECVALSAAKTKRAILNDCFCRFGLGLFSFRPLADPDAFFARLKTNHVQALVFYLKDEDGQLNTTEFQVFVRAARRAEIVPVAIMMYGAGWGLPDGKNRYAREHPEWLKISDPPGKRPLLCVNTPFWDIYLGWVREMVRDNDLGGIVFDELHIGNCRCSYCRDLFRQETGWEIPAINFDDPAFRRYVRWCYAAGARKLRQLVDTVKQTEPDLPVSEIVYSRRGWPLAHDFREVGRLFDWCSHDKRGYLSRSQMIRLYRSITPLRPEIWTSSCSNFLSEFSFGKLALNTFEAAEPLPQALADGLCVVSNGGVANIDYFQTDANQMPRDDGTWVNNRKVNAEILRRIPWLRERQESTATVAIVYSQRTHDYYDRLGERRKANSGLNNGTEFTGVYRALIERQVIFDAFPDDWIFESIPDRIRVLVLPSTVCLADAAAKRIERFVAAGGGLVATYRTGLMDEEGAPRQNTVLADLFGADLVGDGNPDYDFLVRYAGADRVGRKRVEEGAFLRLQTSFGAPSDRPLFCLDIPYLRVSIRDGAHSLGTLTQGKDGLGGVGGLHGIEFDSQENPAVIVREYGAGRVIFLPFCVGALYHYHRQIWAKQLLCEAVRRVHPDGRFPIEINAPPQSEANAYWQPDRNRLVVHLNNYQGLLLDGLGHDGWVSPNVEYIPPLMDVVVDINVSKYGLPRSVYLAPDEMPLNWKDTTDGRIRIEAPRIDAHGMIVIEFRGA